MKICDLVDKINSSQKTKENALKIIAVVIIIAVVFLSLDVFSQGRDSRKQIVDDDGGVEAELCSILSDIDGVGECDVMLQYDEDKVTGAIVTAGGAGDPVVRNNVVNAVMAVFNIPASSVEVFKKEADYEK